MTLLAYRELQPLRLKSQLLPELQALELRLSALELIALPLMLKRQELLSLLQYNRVLDWLHCPAGRAARLACMLSCHLRVPCSRARRAPRPLLRFPGLTGRRLRCRRTTGRQLRVLGSPRGRSLGCGCTPRWRQWRRRCAWWARGWGFLH